MTNEKFKELTGCYGIEIAKHLMEQEEKQNKRESEKARQDSNSKYALEFIERVKSESRECVNNAISKILVILSNQYATTKQSEFQNYNSIAFDIVSEHTKNYFNSNARAEYDKYIMEKVSDNADI